MKIIRYAMVTVVVLAKTMEALSPVASLTTPRRSIFI